MAEDRTHGLKHRSIENIQTEAKREKWEKRVYDKCETNILIDN